MFKKYVCIIAALLIMQVSFSIAGLVWKSDTKAIGEEKENVISFQCYAQGGNVRQDVLKGGSMPLMKEGSYMLFKKDSNSIFIINPKDKTYSELPIDAMMGIAASMMKIEPGDVKVEKLAPEVISGYKCNHIKINSNYSMKMQLMGMEMKVTQEQEIWGTKDLPVSELADLFILQAFKTGWKDLDEQISKQISAMQDIGFPIKSVTIVKQVSAKGAGTQTKTVESISYDIESKKLDDAIFKVPEGYKKIEMFSPGMMRGRQ
jgi:hypothetical protein